MKSTLDFLERNWLLLGLIFLALWIWKSKVTDFRGYKGEIEVLSDSIAKVDMRYGLIEEQLSASLELIDSAIYDRDAYKDTLDELRNKNHNLILRYETEINNLSRVPTDSIYCDVSDWLDKLSIQ